MCASTVLGSIAPRLERAAPARLLKALDAPDAVTRWEAASAVVAFPVGIDSALPALLRIVERNPDTMIGSLCTMKLADAQPSSASVPTLTEALRSPERLVRFRAAELLGRIGPQASEAVPALLLLLKEPFEPVTPFEREYPSLADPAVAAALALNAIAPGTNMTGSVRASLMEFLNKPRHTWIHPGAESDLNRLVPTPSRAPGDELPHDVFAPAP
jgi:HEAT repeat protein